MNQKEDLEKNNEQTILEVALKHFARDGYEAGSVQKICDEVGVSKPTLYHYYGSKQGVLERILETRFAPFLALLNVACSYRGDIDGSVARIIQAFFLFASHDLAMFELMMSLWASADQDVGRKIAQPWLDRQVDCLVRLFRDAKKDHGTLRGRESFCVTCLLSLIDIYVQDTTQTKRALDDRLAQRASKHFLYGCLA